MVTFIHDSEEKRCDCGKLLFKLTTRGLEIKCNRCRQIYCVPMERLTKEFQNICPVINTSEKIIPEAKSIKSK